MINTPVCRFSDVEGLLSDAVGDYLKEGFSVVVNEKCLLFVDYYTFQMKDGSIINGYRRSDRRIPQFEDGLVSDMEFIRLNDINLVHEVSSEDELEQKADGQFIINRDNLPIKAWYYHAHVLTKKYELKW